MINYDTAIRKTPSTLDHSKKNILLIGKGTKNEKAKIILPTTIFNKYFHLLIKHLLSSNSYIV